MQSRSRMTRLACGPAVWPRKWKALPSGATSLSSPIRMRARSRHSSWRERGWPAARASLEAWEMVLIVLSLGHSCWVDAALRHGVETGAAQPELERVPVDRRHHLEGQKQDLKCQHKESGIGELCAGSSEGRLEHMHAALTLIYMDAYPLAGLLEVEAIFHIGGDEGGDVEHLAHPVLGVPIHGTSV